MRGQGVDGPGMIDNIYYVSESQSQKQHIANQRFFYFQNLYLYVQNSSRVLDTKVRKIKAYLPKSITFQNLCYICRRKSWSAIWKTIGGQNFVMGVPKNFWGPKRPPAKLKMGKNFGFLRVPSGPIKGIPLPSVEEGSNKKWPSKWNETIEISKFFTAGTQFWFIIYEKLL